MCEKSFRWRINDLYRETDLSILEFAEKCDISRQSMQYYLKGERMPDSSGLLKICKACSVSADWLLGLSDVRQPSADVRAVCEYIDFSEEAVSKIRNPGIGNPFGKTLSHMVESERFENFITSYKMFLETLRQIDLVNPNSYSCIDFREDGSIVLSAHDAADHFRHQVSSAVDQICFVEYLEHMNQSVERSDGDRK